MDDKEKMEKTEVETSVTPDAKNEGASVAEMPEKAPETLKEIEEIQTPVQAPVVTTEVMKDADVEDSNAPGEEKETYEMPLVDNEVAGGKQEVPQGREFGFSQVPGGYNGVSDQGQGGGFASTMTDDVIGFLQGPYS